MIKLWAKTILGEKITRDQIYKKEEKYNSNDFESYLNDICYEFDIPSPIILKSHINNFENFNITRFRKSDFIEEVDYDFLVVENALE
ncbi:MAG: hypothetical protein FWE22_08525 [Firmicutes bacterium]|nr:hypothetical protein [Bacillota bacterium]